MSDTDKLYLCRINAVYYALARTPEEARSLGEAALINPDEVPLITADEVTDPLHNYRAGWTGDSFVHDRRGRNVRLKDAMKRVGR